MSQFATTKNRMRGTLFRQWLLALVLASGFAIWASLSHLAERVDFQLQDLATSLVTPPADPDIVLVTIDDRSLAQVGAWPWPRSRHARLVETLDGAGAKLIALDVLFLEPTAPAEDTALADAMAQAGKVLLPFTFVSAPGSEAEIQAIFPIDTLSASAAGGEGGLGHVAADFDADGSVRRLALFKDANGQEHPHMMLQTYRALYGREPEIAAGMDAQSPVPIIPLKRSGSYPTISAGEVLSGSIGREFLAGKVVLVGASAQGLGDNFPVPGSAGATMPGIEIQANLLDAMIADRFVTPVLEWMNALLSVLAVVALFVAFWALRPRHNLLLAILLTAGLLVVSLLLPLIAGIWFAPGAALVAIAISYPLWGWRRLVSVMEFLNREAGELRPMAHSDGAAVNGEKTRGFDVVARQMNRFSGLIASIRQAEQERREMLEFLSHDMRSPQVSIIGMTDAATMPMEEAERLKRIKQQAERTLTLADDFVHLARMDEVPLEPVEVDLAALAEEAADRAYMPATARSITVKRNIAEEPALIMADASLVARAMDNLLGNAIRYSPEGSQIDIGVTLSAEAHTAMLTIADQGPGLPPARQSKPFARFHPDEREGGPAGLGLGLALVGQVAERHGARISVDTGPDTGTCFSLEFDLA